MRDRCNNPTHSKYRRYGGRGIKVCARWNTSVVAFIADMGPRPPGMWLERIDNDGNYEPRNCKWATPKEQENNRTGLKRLTFRGTTLCLADWAIRIGISRFILDRRLKHGMPVAVGARRELSEIDAVLNAVIR